jgi:hypothetical protein
MILGVIGQSRETQRFYLAVKSGNGAIGDFFFDFSCQCIYTNYQRELLIIRGSWTW